MNYVNQKSKSHIAFFFSFLLFSFFLCFFFYQSSFRLSYPKMLVSMHWFFIWRPVGVKGYAFSSRHLLMNCMTCILQLANAMHGTCEDPIPMCNSTRFSVFRHSNQSHTTLDWAPLAWHGSPVESKVGLEGGVRLAQSSSIWLDLFVPFFPAH